MNQEIFSNISKIIERDSKSSTYKFALLRGIIDIIQEDSPYIHVGVSRVKFPMGLLVEKWMEYYYPLLESPLLIPQINGNTRLAFQEDFKTIIQAYSEKGGMSVFFHELKTGTLDEPIQAQVYTLAKNMARTIADKPMRFIGGSISTENYSIFSVDSPIDRGKPARVELQSLIKHLGVFSIPFEYFQVFQFIGSFISGQDSILMKWAEFSVNASGRDLRIEQAVNRALIAPVTERQVKESKRLYQSMLNQEGTVRCVWTNERLRSYDIDHAIPFSVWRNNDLWNLLPSRSSINQKKRDQIPSPQLIHQQQDSILYYWKLLGEYQPERFRREVQLSLLGNDHVENWEIRAIERLQHNCNYLINKRGYREWTL